VNQIAKTATRFLEAQQDFVLATIVSRQGSAPRTAGTRMIVGRDGRAIGTVGGGSLEARVIQTAGQVLSSRRPLLLSFDMTPAELAAMDMICGGQLEVLLEVIEPGSTAATVFKGRSDLQATPGPYLFLTVVHLAEGDVKGVDHCLLKNRRPVYGHLPLDDETLEKLIREHSDAVSLRTVPLDDTLILVEPVLPVETVLVFGAGHVAQPTAQLAALVGFRVQVADDRAEFANRDRFPMAWEIRVIKNFESALEGLVIDNRSFIVILTRGHLHDQTVLAQALVTDAGYIGMIGSRRKRDHIYGTLLKHGFTEADLNRVHCPIGLDIDAETPEEIALSIVAELVQVRAQRHRS
jgi:xanthine dehydrogenase accessory factor